MLSGANGSDAATAQGGTAASSGSMQCAARCTVVERTLDAPDAASLPAQPVVGVQAPEVLEVACKVKRVLSGVLALHVGGAGAAPALIEALFARE